MDIMIVIVPTITGGSIWKRTKIERIGGLDTTASESIHVIGIGNTGCSSSLERTAMMIGGIIGMGWVYLVIIVSSYPFCIGIACIVAV